MAATESQQPGVFEVRAVEQTLQENLTLLADAAAIYADVERITHSRMQRLLSPEDEKGEDEN